MNARTMVLSLGFLVGCGVSPAGNPETYHDFLSQQRQIRCEATFRCCNTKCSTTTDDTFYTNVATFQKAIEAGKLGFDATLAAQCLESMQRFYSDCDALTPNLPTTTLPCGQVLIGKIPTGMPCQTNFALNAGLNACVAGSYCDSSMAMLGMGTCRQYTPDMGVCNMAGAAPCKPTSYCDNTMLAMPGVCRPKAKANEGCPGIDRVQFTQECDTSQQNLVCLPTRSCGPRLDTGASCEDSTQCRSSSCIKAPMVTMGMCAAPAVEQIVNTLRDNLCGVSQAINRNP